MRTRERDWSSGDGLPDLEQEENIRVVYPDRRFPISRADRHVPRPVLVLRIRI